VSATYLTTTLSVAGVNIVVDAITVSPTVSTTDPNAADGDGAEHNSDDNDMEVSVIVAIVVGIIAVLVLSCGLIMVCKPSEQKTTTVQTIDIRDSKQAAPVA